MLFPFIQTSRKRGRSKVTQNLWSFAKIKSSHNFTANCQKNYTDIYLQHFASPLWGCLLDKEPKKLAKQKLTYIPLLSNSETVGHLWRKVSAWRCNNLLNSQSSHLTWDIIFTSNQMRCTMFFKRRRNGDIRAEELRDGETCAPQVAKAFTNFFWTNILVANAFTNFFSANILVA